jgi:hypothetical protein
MRAADAHCCACWCALLRWLPLLRTAAHCCVLLRDAAHCCALLRAIAHYLLYTACWCALLRYCTLLAARCALYRAQQKAACGS